jgi:hypothetical protein
MESISQYLSNKPSMEKYRDMYNAKQQLNNWEEYQIRHGFNAMFEAYFTSSYVKALRNTEIEGTFFRDPSADDPNSVLISFSLAESTPKSAKLLMDDETVEVMRGPRAYDDDGKLMPEFSGWEASMISSGGEINHIGTYLMRVKVSDDALDSLNIIDTWTPDAPTNTIYLKVTDSSLPVRLRLNALNNLAPAQTSVNSRKKALKDDELFQEDGAEDRKKQATNESDQMVNKSLLRSLLVGASLDKLFYRDIFEGLTDAQVDSVLSLCTDKQVAAVRGFHKRVPLGILLQTGASGTGKTTCTVHLILARMLKDQSVGVYASANAAVNNIYGRLVEESKKMNTLPDDKLFVRMWSSRLEEKVVTMVDRENIDRLKTAWVAKTCVNSTNLVGGKGKSKFKRLRESTDYDFKSSIAWLICQVAGLVEQENEKVARLSQDPKYEELREIMSKLVLERTPEEVSTLRKQVDEITMDLMDVIDILFATTTAGASKAGKKFAARAHLCVIDEAGATTELELLSVYRGGSQQLFLVGDRAQLPPTLLSDNAKFADGSNRRVNPFARDGKYPLMSRLMQLGWPYWEQSEQLRMAPGAFKLVNHVTYKNKIEYHSEVDYDQERFSLGREVRDWVESLNIHGLRSEEPTSLMRSCEKEMLPFIVDVQNSFTYTALRGFSKGNTANAHFMLAYIEAMLAACPRVDLGEHVYLVVPYLEQQKVYRTIVANHSKWSRLNVITANKVQGHEREIVFFDGTASASLNGKVGFVADPHRLAVVFSRHRNCFVMVMDMECLQGASGHSKKDVKEEKVSDDAEIIESEILHDVTSLSLALEWFRDNNRIVYEDAGSISESPYLRQINNEEDLQVTTASSAPQTSKLESSNQVESSTVSQSQSIVPSSPVSQSQSIVPSSTVSRSPSTSAFNANTTGCSENDTITQSDPTIPPELQSANLARLAGQVVESAEFDRSDYWVLRDIFKLVSDIAGGASWQEFCLRLRSGYGLIPFCDTLEDTVVYFLKRKTVSPTSTQQTTIPTTRTRVYTPISPAPTPTSAATAPTAPTGLSVQSTAPSTQLGTEWRAPAESNVEEKDIDWRKATGSNEGW